MVFEVVWSKKARASFRSQLDYLEKHWTIKEYKAFADLVEKQLDLLTRQPYVGSVVSVDDDSIRRTLVHKRVLLFYKVSDKQRRIELLLFWNTHQNPAGRRL